MSQRDQATPPPHGARGSRLNSRQSDLHSHSNPSPGLGSQRPASIQGSALESSFNAENSSFMTRYDDTPSKNAAAWRGGVPGSSPLNRGSPVSRGGPHFPPLEYGHGNGQGESVHHLVGATESIEGTRTDENGGGAELGNSKRFATSVFKFITSLDSENEEDQPGSPFAALNRQTTAGTFAKRSGPYARSSFMSGDRNSLTGDLTAVGMSGGTPKRGEAGGGWGINDFVSSFGHNANNLFLNPSSLPVPSQNMYRSRRFLVISAMMQLCVVGWLIVASLPRLGGGWLSLPFAIFTALAARTSALAVERFCFNHRDHLVSTSFVDLAEASGGKKLRVVTTFMVLLFWFGAAAVLYSFCAILLFSSTPILAYGSTLPYYSKYLDYVAVNNEQIVSDSDGPDTTIPPILDVRWYYGAVGAGLLVLSVIGALMTRRGVVRLWNMYLLNILTVVVAFVAIVFNIIVAATRRGEHKTWTTLLPEGLSGGDFLVDGFAKTLTLMAWSAIFVILVPRLGTTHPFFARLNDSLPIELEVGGGTRGTLNRVLTKFGAVLLAILLAVLITVCLLFSDAPQVIVLFENFHRPSNFTTSLTNNNDTLPTATTNTPSSSLLKTSGAVHHDSRTHFETDAFGQHNTDQVLLRICASLNMLLVLFLLVLCHRCCTECCIMVWSPPVILNSKSGIGGSGARGGAAGGAGMDSRGDGYGTGAYPHAYQVQDGLPGSSPPSSSSNLERSRISSEILSGSSLYTPTPQFKHPQGKLESCWNALVRKLKRSKLCKCCFSEDGSGSCCCAANCFSSCCGGCCTSPQSSAHVRRRSGGSRFSIKGFFKTAFRCVVLPLAWFICCGVGSYFFVCGLHSPTCGTDIEGGRYDAAPMSRWLLAMMSGVSGLIVIPLAFALPCLFDFVLGKLMDQAIIGGKYRQREFTSGGGGGRLGSSGGLGNSGSGVAGGSSATLSSGRVESGAIPVGSGGINSLHADAMGPAIGGGNVDAWDHQHGLLGSGGGEEDFDKINGDGSGIIGWMYSSGFTYLYRAYCILLTIFGLIAVIQVIFELATGTAVQV